MRPPLLLACLALGACSSYEDRVEATCQRHGLDYGTPEFSRCMEHEEAMDQQDRAMWGGMMTAGAGMMQPSRPMVLIGE